VCLPMATSDANRRGSAMVYSQDDVSQSVAAGHAAHPQSDGMVCGAMRVEPIEALSDNYMYLIIDNESKQAAAVDPADAEECVAVAKKLGVTITTVLTTHHHFDHAGGNDNMKKLLGSALEVVGGDSSIQGMTRSVRDGEILPLGSLQIRCVHTPCHTSGHMSYVASSPNSTPAVFTGDALFVGGCGRFFEGTPEQMVETAARLAALPPETAVFCGHEYTTKNLEYAYDVDPENPAVRNKRSWAEGVRAKGGRTVPSTIREELSYNPFMRVTSEAVRAYTGASAPVEAMRILRNKKDKFAGSSRPWIPGGGPLPGL